MPQSAPSERTTKHSSPVVLIEVPLSRNLLLRLDRRLRLRRRLRLHFLSNTWLHGLFSRKSNGRRLSRVGVLTCLPAESPCKHPSFHVDIIKRLFNRFDLATNSFLFLAHLSSHSF